MTPMAPQVETSTGPRYGVAGYPVAHSRSPAMHTAAYHELGIDAIYQLLPIPPELFDETVRALPASGFRGINVTIPHKEAAAALAEKCSPAATAIGAANTLSFINGEIHAENTDAAGLIAALDQELQGQRALILGAGGTARAAVWALTDAGANVEIHNRTPERAAELAKRIGTSASAVDNTNNGEGYDLIINTTSVGMDASTTEHEALSALGLSMQKISPQATIVDFVYREGGSPLTNAATSNNIRVIDGLTLLANQGALSFEHWFNQPAPLAAMQAAAATG